MNITDDHIVILGAIYDTEGQALNIATFCQEREVPKEKVDPLVSELVANDMIETEEEEGVYFLTPYGYEYLEAYDYGEKKPRKEAFQDFGRLNEAVQEMGSSKALKRTTFWLLLFGVVITALMIFLPELFKADTPAGVEKNDYIMRDADSIRSESNVRDSLNSIN
ncbi:hypothetical protein LVD15_05720 [Fulvivirga maritima]|uniref:hypothetical protein n=1 Tax=Fulvivirga maritima TaxID=2904247 RepID=UPI001F40915A|nr:hypothetical protein [Fulvivirga maritima]UII27918.1 hypothetical protein LVD15_05720 [Fulvivirga maritima]